ncbi:MAG: hypothetical protein R2834_22375 [Rhodothermales bacterium]
MIQTFPHFRMPLLAVLFAVLAAGCSPRVSFLYVDYEIDGDPATMPARVAEGFEAAGWQVTGSEIENAIRTESRTFNRRILYKTIAYMEAVPIGDDYVRVYIHPFRHPFIGARNKLPYMPAPLRRSVFPDLTEALEAREIYLRGAPRPELPVQ